ncbi:hypothetical protein B0A55_01010 [Friedmanniomyces simplex]|uniref:Transcription factor domain-containing protein n=1 Tax=Friedmanniomyces simplex TaxID=329884 RepID=A0A4U0Y6X0_9PEZI|nr:hypothetical protein B0A55_01010 [Friedmanniomyces simplex]
MSFLEGVVPDEFLLKPIVACGLAAIANRENDPDGREVARRYYIEAIAATNTTLRHPRQVKEDNTLIAVALLGCFERLNWESNSSMLSWKHHVEGATQLLRLRGRGQLRTTGGMRIFRDIRANITLKALLAETKVPDFVVQWSAALEYDPLQTPSDQLSMIAARTWRIIDPDSPQSLNGVRHEYSLPQAHRDWNIWRGLNIILSRTQEAIVRRSWPTLAQAPPSPQYYRTIRDHMTTDICVAAACALGNESTADSLKGSIANGYLLIFPLFLAGTYLLEQLAEPSVSPGGSRIILVDEPLHTDPFTEASVQLAGVIERIDHINGLGIQWAASVSKILRGECRVYYDLGRSRVVREAEIEALLGSEVLDLSSVVTAPSGEE